MALNFPASPTEGQIYAAEGATYIYHNGRWVVLSNVDMSVYVAKAGDTMTGNLLIENTGPSLRLHESDATEPKGRWMFQAGASGGVLGVYNATATDWSATNTFMSFQANGYNSILYDRIFFGVPISGLTIKSNVPELRFDEADTVSPAGQYRVYVNSDVLYCQRATGVDYSATATIWSYDGAAPVFTVPNAALIGNVGVNRDKGGSVTSGRIAATAAGGPTLQSFDSASFIFTYLNTTLTGRFDAAGVTAPVQTYSVVTKEKGDARYTAISSRRYKDDISTQPLNKLVHAFDHLVPHTWVWGGDLPDGDERAGTTGLGFIAEEVEDVLPAAVVYRYDTMSPALLENGEDDPDSPTIDTSKKHVDALDHGALIAVLYAKIKQLEARLETVEGIV